MKTLPAPLLITLSLAAPVYAETSTDDAQSLDAITVLGRRANLIGAAVSASEGEIGPEELSERPRLRPGDLVEFVPGMIATQHSGSGKANQYFLRGFNLDHGTDFATEVEGMPVNLRSHGHGQGYSDLNFLIPELVESLRYRKGSYYADVGDFSSAGSAEFNLAGRRDRSELSLGLGSFGYARGVATGGAALSALDLVYGLELQGYEGPWSDIDESVRKRNVQLKTRFDLGEAEASAAVMIYRNRWNSPDQIPARAVSTGLIDRLGSLDTDLGGQSARTSLSGSLEGESRWGNLHANAYAIDYELDLWSNFTYLLDDPDAGDEFRQRDRRRVIGFDMHDSIERERWRLRIGMSGQRDDIEAVGLCRTVDRQCRRDIRDDQVDERSLSLWTDLEYRFSPQLRSYVGWRHDRYDFEVDAIETENSGKSDASISSPKFSLVYTPGSHLELYASWGRGFHSNDARGTTLRRDPLTGDEVQTVTPLARSEGSELGARLFLSERVHATLALWQLDLDSELLYVGDAGTTEANRPSERQGVEFGWYWFASERYSAELEVQYTDTRFADQDPAGRKIPGAVPLSVAAGISARWDNGWNANLRWRHVGDYSLIEDGSVEAGGSDLVNLRLGREFQAWRLDLEVLNLLGSNDRDISYFYASRLEGEPLDGIEDQHFHAFEPRAWRINLTRTF